MAKKLTGWSTRGRPFSPVEYKRSYLKKNTRASYSKYLSVWSSQYKKGGTKRKNLVKN